MVQFCFLIPVTNDLELARLTQLAMEVPQLKSSTRLAEKEEKNQQQQAILPQSEPDITPKPTPKGKGKGNFNY